MGHNEPQWRTNSSFSPPPLWRWDRQFQSDGSPHCSYEAPLNGSSLSSNSKGSRGRASSDQYTDHYHSVSDGVFSYFGSPSDNFQLPQWTPLVQKSNSGSISAASCFPQSAERLFIGGASAVSNSFGSPSTLSESSHWEPTGKQPISSSCRNFSSRRSFMSKPVYPLVFRNPVPDTVPFDSTDKNSTSRLILGENRTSPSDWPNNSCGLLHKTFSRFQKMEACPETNKSSRREGFRLSSASSYDLAFDGEGFDMSEYIDKEFRWPNCSRGDQNCGLCGIWQKSPWSSRRIVSSGNMPIAAVLHCTHVFHAECLDQTTPKTDS